MQSYCLKSEKHTDKVCPKQLILMTNMKIKGISICADCLPIKSFSEEIKDKDELEVIVCQFLID